jgi:DegV family protein with EDD domain
MYEFLASHYESVVSIALSAKVSGTCNAARTAAARLPTGRVTVIDSLNASLGQGLLAVYAAECAQAGLSGAEVVAATQRMIPRTRTFGLLVTVEYAVRGGRVPPFFRPMARVLRLAPIIATFPDGKVKLASALFGRRRLRSRYGRFIRRQLKPGLRYRIAVGHAHDESGGRALLDEITAGLTCVESSWLTGLGTALGAHGGPGMLVVAIQEYEPPAHP